MNILIVGPVSGTTLSILPSSELRLTRTDHSEDGYWSVHGMCFDTVIFDSTVDSGQIKDSFAALARSVDGL